MTGWVGSQLCDSKRLLVGRPKPSCAGHASACTHEDIGVDQVFDEREAEPYKPLIGKQLPEAQDGPLLGEAPNLAGNCQSSRHSAEDAHLSLWPCWV